TDYDSVSAPSDLAIHENNALRNGIPSSSDHEAEVMNIDDAIESSPIGLFHYRLLFICGLAYMADAIEISLLSFIVVLITEEWSLSVIETSSIAATVFAGSMVGNVFLWGPLGDAWGRRKTFIAGSSLVCLAGLSCALAPNIGVLLFCNFFVGIGVGCVFISLDLLAELLPCEWRGLFLMNINYFWTLGSMFVASMAWTLLDAYGWRILIVSAALPAVLTVMLSVFYLPESPRWLMLQGRTGEANAVLNEVNRVNRYGSNNSVKHIVFNLTPLTPAELEEHSGGHGCSAYFDLIAPKYRRVTVLLGILSLSWGLTYNGTVMFLSSMFAASDDDSIAISTNSTLLNDFYGNDDAVAATSFQYGDILTVASSELIGIFMTSMLLDRIGRRWTQSLMYANGFLSCMCLAFSTQGPTSTTVVFLSAWARISIIGASGATVVTTPELYPTEVRVPGHVVAATMSRVGTVICPYIAQNKYLGVRVVGIVFGLFNLCSVFFALSLPETMGHSVD
ncbi:unnamed protein product, partial [Ectocarpus fasciculatus]